MKTSDLTWPPLKTDTHHTNSVVSLILADDNCGLYVDWVLLFRQLILLNEQMYVPDCIERDAWEACFYVQTAWIDFENLFKYLSIESTQKFL